ncbi:aldehyde dehydrogenase family protein [Bacillus sp. 1P06AnD]|uniref:aldehyde dehydrogenase family protein n=1 Tax=Bacillus sp. 1P06AnD TaxID=3132208 RepID=UPI0039A3E22C
MSKDRMYINNRWTDGSNGEKRPVINPATEEVIAEVADGTKEDAEKAIKAAHQAFYENGWGDTSARERSELLLKAAIRLEERASEIARIETINNGKTLPEAEGDVADAVNQLRYYAGIATKPSGQVYDVPEDIQAMVVKEPIGVVAQIVPWNYPLVMAVQKLAPALAAGCTVVIKPAEQTPLSLIAFFEILDEIGFPPGVANLVLGAGETVGAVLAESPMVDMISFTGGTDTGKFIMRAAADHIKKVSLELGGKSPNIVFEDAEFNSAVDYAMYAIFANQGQVCSAGSRLLLQESIYDKFVSELVERTKGIKVGSGLDKETEMGPLISQEHMEKVLSYIEIGKREGAELLCGGTRMFDKGYFVAPAIFTGTTPDMRIVREEIFGPVLVIQTFKDEKEAIRLANDSDYGLAGAVFTNDGAKALRVIKKLRAGITWINTYHPTFNEAPWGGYKQSGIGRELGTFGFEEYLETKQININLDVKPSGWYK